MAVKQETHRMRVHTKTILSLLVITTLFVGCSKGSDVQVLNLDDGSVVGEVSPSFSGKYRNLVEGIDDTSGRLALVEWGDSQSVLRIAAIRPWKVSEYPIKAGRSTGPLTGIDGPMGFDFSNNRFLYSTGAYSGGESSIVELALNGEKRSCPVPLRPKYIISKIMPRPEGVFVEAGNTGGDYFGYSILRISMDTGSSKDIYHSEGACEAIGVFDKAICLVDRRKDHPLGATLVGIDLNSLKQVEHDLKWDGRMYAIGDGYILQLSADEQTLRRIAITSPDKAQEFTVPPQEGYKIYGLCVSRDHALLRMQNKENGDQYLLVVDLASGKTKTIKIGIDRHSVRAFTFAGANYVVVSE
jgi:hypothetical protein